MSKKMVLQYWVGTLRVLVQPEYTGQGAKKSYALHVH